MSQFSDFRFGVYSTTWDDEGEPVKDVCRNPHTGQRYRANDLNTSLSFDEALSEVEELQAHSNDVYGLILFMPPGLVCVDLDGTDSATTADDIRNAHYSLIEGAPTWVEKSVSGVGYHAFYSVIEAEQSQLTNTNNGDKQVDTRVVNGFVFMTGDVLEGYDGGIAPFEGLHPSFRQYLFERSEVRIKADEVGVKWREQPWKDDLEVVTDMFMRYPDTAKYLNTRQDQTGKSELHFSLLKDLIKCSLNYEQTSRIYRNSKCAEYPYRSNGKSSYSASSYEKWLERNIVSAAKALDEEGGFTDTSLVHINLLGEDEVDDSTFDPIWGQAVQDYTGTEWLIDGVVPAKGVMSVYGPSGSGKTFLVLDMVYAVSRGIEWFERKTQRAPVTYFGLEGQAGILNRAYAYNKHHGVTLEDCKLAIYPYLINLLDESDRERVIRTVFKQEMRGGVIVIDTLAKSAPAMDENANKDMSAYMHNIEQMAKDTNCLVLLVHHSGKDTEKGPRGHSSFIAGIDAAVEVRRTEGSEVRAWKVRKMKDGNDDASDNFTLKAIEIGVNQWGDTDTSCIIERAANVEEFIDAAVVDDAECDFVRFLLLTYPEVEVRNTSKGSYSFVSQFSQTGEYPEEWKGDNKRVYNAIEQAVKRGYIEIIASYDVNNNKREILVVPQ